jgi:hypothetical protein
MTTADDVRFLRELARTFEEAEPVRLSSSTAEGAMVLQFSAEFAGAIVERLYAVAGRLSGLDDNQREVGWQMALKEAEAAFDPDEWAHKQPVDDRLMTYLRGLSDMELVQVQNDARQVGDLVTQNMALRVLGERQKAGE